MKKINWLEEGYPFKVQYLDGWHMIIDSDGYPRARFYSSIAHAFVEAVEHHVHLTAYRRWLWVSICINIVLLLVVASTFGGR